MSELRDETAVLEEALGSVKVRFEAPEITAVTIEGLQKQVTAFEKSLVKAIDDELVSKEDAMVVYERFQKIAEKHANKILMQEESTKLHKRIARKAFDLKYRLKNLVHRKKFQKNNRRLVEMINTMTIKDLKEKFAELNYICNNEVASTVWLALKQQKPIILEGPAGVGKTEIAKCLAKIFDTELIRLQCYEGLDESKALFEWNYSKQLLTLQSKKGDKEDIFGEEYLMERPLLKAIRAPKLPVLLIDEIDKTDEEFEAFLLELLSDFQVSIPELGTIQAKAIPPVILTSNNMRELSDPLKRRCFYLHVDNPTIDTEAEILIKKAPGIQPVIAKDIAIAMHNIRTKLNLRKDPSISESIDLAQALVTVDAPKLVPAILDQLANLYLKNRDDQARFRAQGGGQWALKQQ